MKNTQTEHVTVKEADAFDALGDLPADYAHAAVVDYPWQFEIQNGTGRFEYRREPRHGTNGDTAGARDLEHPDAMFKMEPSDRLGELLDHLAHVLVDGAWVVFMADDRFQDHVRTSIRDSPFILRRNWVWTPESMGMGYYGRIDHYPMPVATLGETERKVKDRSTLFRIPGGRDTSYPTGKPTDLYRQLLAPPVLRDGERLLEPFCGSGPGLAVAAERGLSYWGCDVDVDAVKLAKKRLKQQRLTGWST